MSENSPFTTLGGKAGNKTKALSVSEMPAHNHAIWGGYGDTGSGDTFRYQKWAGSGRSFKYTLGSQQQISTEGGGQAFDILNPYILVNYEVIAG